MKNYLDLIPISAKVHKRQSLLTLICISASVFLVTTIFSMADMGVRIEMSRLGQKHGSAELDSLLQSSSFQTLYTTAAIISILVLIAGVLMIARSIGSSVAKRTNFFGMMRCIGMSKKQIMHYVTLEALNWCKVAVPIGLITGILFTWIFCGVLHFIVGEEFSSMPLWGVSPIGIICGIVMGISTVLLAAVAPAKRAARVSPISAVSGGFDSHKNTDSIPHCGSLKVEIALGIHHALSEKKNLLLMTGSFALSIILFLCLTVMIELINNIMPQSSVREDIVISADASSGSSNLIDSDLTSEIKTVPGVDQVFGRRSSLNVLASVKGLDKDIDIISFDDYELMCLGKDEKLRFVSSLDKVYGDSTSVIAIWDHNNPLKIGDVIQVGGQKLTVSCLLKADPFSGNGDPDGKVTIITSGETFLRLFGTSDYSLMLVQLKENAPTECFSDISNIVSHKYTVTNNQSIKTSSTYRAFVLFAYGFLIIIALVTLLNIINSISMSALARMKQYGSMHAIGMSGYQITRMIMAEALTYANTGCIAGCFAGLLLSRFLYCFLITRHFPNNVWSFPYASILLIILFVMISVLLAVYTSSKQIKNTSVVDAISDL